MSAHIEGTYRIFYQHGCLAGKKTNYPLTIEAPNNPEHEVWDVKNGDHGHIFVLKSSPNMGLTFPGDVFRACPILLDEHPRPVRLLPGPLPDHFIVIPSFGHEELAMATGPTVDDAPKVSWQPMDARSIWRFERA